MSRDHLQISGKVTDKRGELRYVLKGYWERRWRIRRDEKMED